MGAASGLKHKNILDCKLRQRTPTGQSISETIDEKPGAIDTVPARALPGDHLILSQTVPGQAHLFCLSGAYTLERAPHFGAFSQHRVDIEEA